MSDAGHGPAYITSRGRAIGNAVDKIEAVKTPHLPERFPWFGGNLPQEPSSPLRLIDPHFDQARCGDIAKFRTDFVSFSQEAGQDQIVVAKL